MHFVGHFKHIIQAVEVCFTAVMPPSRASKELGPTVTAAAETRLQATKAASQDGRYFRHRRFQFFPRHHGLDVSAARDFQRPEEKLAQLCHITMIACLTVRLRMSTTDCIVPGYS
jgi:hypothetical protein